ncbi:MAG: hypothetical protein AAGA57_03270 [Planctomycetota bacterium]
MRRPSPCRRGLTLVELLLASAGAALVAAAALAVLGVAQYGEEDAHDYRTLVASRKAAHARLTASLRECRQVLAFGADYMVLWRSDLDGDDTPDLLELRRLSYDAAADTITLYDADPSATDVSYALTDNFQTVTDGLITAGTMTGRTWVTEVDAFTPTLDDATAADAAVVVLTLRITPGAFDDWLVVESRLRTDEGSS